MVRRLGRYELIKEIGAGGMAHVHLARVVGEGGFERLVAVKVMYEQMARDRDFVAMFLDEARLAAKIRHPNVVGTIDVQRTDDGIFLVMDYVDGLSLGKLLRLLRRAGEPMPLGVALRIVIDALNGLSAAHQLKDRDGQPLKLIHRDVSPQNVLIGSDGVSRLTDFGVARAEARLSSTAGGQIKGKVPYMSPEQIASDDFDQRSDLFAAGVVLWEALVGKRLFKADNQLALMHRVLEGDIAPPSSLRDDIPAAIDALCIKALARDPNRRHQSATAFVDAIEEAAAEASVRVAGARKVASFIEPYAPKAASLPPAPPSSPSQVTPMPKMATLTSFERPPDKRRSSKLVVGGVAAAAVAALVAWMSLPAAVESVPAAATAVEAAPEPEEPAPVEAKSASVPAEASASATAVAAVGASASAPSADSATPAPIAKSPPAKPTPKAPRQPAPKPKNKSAADFLPPDL